MEEGKIRERIEEMRKRKLESQQRKKKDVRQLDKGVRRNKGKTEESHRKMYGVRK